MPLKNPYIIQRGLRTRRVRKHMHNAKSALMALRGEAEILVGV
jgi:hypothetical protein